MSVQWYMLALPMAAAFGWLFRVARRQMLPSADWPQAFSAACWLAFGIYDVFVAHVAMRGIAHPIRPEVPKLLVTLVMLSTASLVTLGLAFLLLRGTTYFANKRLTRSAVQLPD